MALVAAKNVAIRMRDGVTLYANVYRPAGDARVPAILSVTPYGKDRTPDWLGMLLMRLSRVRFGHLETSRLTGFEAPDPAFWTGHAYAVVQADVRGMHRSEGQASVLTDIDAREVSSFPLAGTDIVVRVGRYGPYLERGEQREQASRPPHRHHIQRQPGGTDRRVRCLEWRRRPDVSARPRARRHRRGQLQHLTST